MQNDMKFEDINVDQVKVVLKTNNVGIMINGDMNAKNQFTMVDVIEDLFKILVYVDVNVMHHVMLENIQIMKIVNVEKS